MIKKQLAEKLEGRENVKIKRINNTDNDLCVNMVLEIDGVEIYVGGQRKFDGGDVKADLMIDYNDVGGTKGL